MFSLLYSGLDWKRTRQQLRRERGGICEEVESGSMLPAAAGFWAERSLGGKAAFLLAGWASDTASGTLQRALELSLEGLIGARVGWRHAGGTGTAIGRFGIGEEGGSAATYRESARARAPDDDDVKVWGKEGEEVLRSSVSQEADQDGSSRVEARRAVRGRREAATLKEKYGWGGMERVVRGSCGRERSSAFHTKIWTRRSSQGLFVAGRGPATGWRGRGGEGWG